MGAVACRRSFVHRAVAVLMICAAFAAHSAQAASASRAASPPGTVLDTHNFTDAGDAVTDILDTSGLAFSTLPIGTAALGASGGQSKPRAARASFVPPRTTAFPQTFESPCPAGGHVRASVTDSDGSQDLSAGDRFATEYDSCAIEGSTVTGRSEFTVASHRYERGIEIIELEFRFTALGTAQMRWTGTAHMTLRADWRHGTERYLIQYRDLEVERGSRHMRWSFVLDLLRPPVGDQVASVGGALAVGALQLRLRQDEPFVMSLDGVARSGELTAVDRLGARLQVRANPTRYVYRLYLANRRGDHANAQATSRPHDSR